MTTEERAARLAAIAERAAAATGGPWYWKGWTTSHSVYLVSGISMRPVVLDFGRWGMNSARPIFRDAARDMLIKPRFIGRHGRYDDGEIVGIDHPDARFIEHSRADIDFLLTEVGTLRAALAALVADDFDAWTSSIYEEFWQCNYCNAHGADISDEPRVRDHKADCPWLLARALVGHTVPTEEGNDGE